MCFILCLSVVTIYSEGNLFIEGLLLKVTFEIKMFSLNKVKKKVLLAARVTFFAMWWIGKNFLRLPLWIQMISSYTLIYYSKNNHWENNSLLLSPVYRHNFIGQEARIILWKILDLDNCTIWQGISSLVICFTCMGG